MPERKRHLLIDGFRSTQNFSSRRRGRSPAVSLRARTQHGLFLSRRFNILLNQRQRQLQAVEPITDDSGIYVEFISFEGQKLPLDSLDTRDFRLYACRIVDNCEVALVFIPESRRLVFLNKIAQYLNPEKDSVKNDVPVPRNHPLIGSISDVRLADLKAFWTDNPLKYPQDPDQEMWWELWLKKRAGENTAAIAVQLSERIGGHLANTSVSFFDSIVFLIKTSARQLERAPELISCLEELRLARETPTVFVEMQPKEQHEWAADLRVRMSVEENSAVAVSILDTGVNYHHSLLANVCSRGQAVVWNPEWAPYDEIPGHGSRQAGLATFGDLHAALLSTGSIRIPHQIESGRILPPAGANDPELYGAITIDTAKALERLRPEWRRVYSLAITAESSDEGGLPTSWSAELDRFTCGIDDNNQRLFIVSAGNNRSIRPDVDPWEQAQLSEIEDPAQSWNALTIGAYTELTSNDDAGFHGWSAFSKAGDIAPSSRSSVNWSWRRHAPLKPELVAEGGNRLLSPNQTEVSEADCVSLLTTSGKTAGQLFEVSGDTSAACALVSRQAAFLMADYSNLWPETIRGLLVHSARWTTRMWERFGVLLGQHTPKVAVETMLRMVGYGVTDLERARFSADNALTLIAQEELQPFKKREDHTDSDDPCLNAMQLYQLPWPIQALAQLPGEMEAMLRVTLSYFVEPNPGRRGYRQRYSYQSCGLRFDVIRPNQSLPNFLASINKNSQYEGYDAPEGERDGWQLGPQLCARGSLHSDTWKGTVAELMDMHTIAVYPVSGWWKYQVAKDRWQKSVRYSLIVSIDVPDENVDIYSEVENVILASVEVKV